MGFFQQHVFFCCNQKQADKKCCAQADAQAMAAYAKCLVKKHDQWGQGKIRVSTAGCLGRCAAGPCLVVYPQGDWYTYQGQEEVELIINALMKGERADNLTI